MGDLEFNVKKFFITMLHVGIAVGIYFLVKKEPGLATVLAPMLSMVGGITPSPKDVGNMKNPTSQKESYYQCRDDE